MAWQCWRDKVETRSPKRVTAAQPCQRHPAPQPQPEPADRLGGIGGAGRQVPAVKPDEWRQVLAIGATEGLADQSGTERENSDDLDELGRGRWTWRRAGLPAVLPAGSVGTIL